MRQYLRNNVYIVIQVYKGYIVREKKQKKQSLQKIHNVFSVTH